MRGKLKKKICMIMISVLCMFSICSMNTEYVVAANVLSKNQKQSFNKAIEKFIKDEMIPDEEVKNVYFTLKQLLPGSQKSADYPYQAFKRSF